MTPILELRDLRKSFGRTEVIRGASLSVRAGERLAIIGPNGAGKSTLFHLVSGRFAPTSGEVWLQGRRIDGLSPHQVRRLGLARSFQVTNLFPRLTAYENLQCAVMGAMGLRYRFLQRLSGLREVRAQAEDLVARLRLQDQRDVPAQHLAYAQQRALEIGLAVAGDAPVVLLDEPTAGMSHSETAHFTALVRELTEGRTLVLVEHDMGVVFDLADRVAVLAGGEFIACDTPQRVRADERVRQAYLGGDALAREEG